MEKKHLINPILILLSLLALVAAHKAQAAPSTYIYHNTFLMDDDTPDAKTLRERLHRLSPLHVDEVLWLARCIYSESDRKHEQEVIAWVVRNRVETEYRGSNYREVVLEPLQFSTFNKPSPRRAYILSLNQSSTSAAWLQALSIALDVYEADPIERPIPSETRHFYSPVSMVGNRTPAWAKKSTPLDVADLDIDPNRFLFYEDIDESADPFTALVNTPQVRIDDFQESTRSKLKPSSKRTSLRDRWKPSGRVARPLRPRASRKN